MRINMLHSWPECGTFCRPFIINQHLYSRGRGSVFSVKVDVPVILHQQSQTPVIPCSLSHTGENQQQELQQTRRKGQTDPVYTVTMCARKNIISWPHHAQCQFIIKCWHDFCFFYHKFDIKAPFQKYILSFFFYFAGKIHANQHQYV